MIYEAAVSFRPRLLRVTLVDPSAPLAPVGRPAKSPPPPPPPEPAIPGPTPEMLARLREELDQEAARAEERRREERAALERVMSRLTELARDLREQQRTRLEEMQQVAVELAVAVASHVVYERLEAGDYAVEELVRRAVRRLEPREAVTVYLHPDDLALMERRLGEGPTLALDGDEIRLVAEPALARGDCRAETGDLSVVSHLEEHLEQIRQDLLRFLPEAEVERRKSGDDRSLRRYPDRRHTA